MLTVPILALWPRQPPCSPAEGEDGINAAVASSVMANPGRSSAQACSTGPSFHITSPPPPRLPPCPILTLEGEGLLRRLHLQLTKPNQQQPKAAKRHHSQDFRRDLGKSPSPTPPPPLCFLLQVEKCFLEAVFLQRGQQKRTEIEAHPGT